MTVYTCSGSLPEPWEDFFAKDKEGLNVTIEAGYKWVGEDSTVKLPVTEIEITLENDGWWQISIPGKEITRETAIEILEMVANDNVELIETGFCQSVTL
jgi:hypothetical protein